MRNTRVLMLAAAAAILIAGSSAFAAQITGAFSMEGGWAPVPGPGIVGATGVDFEPLGGGDGDLLISNSAITGDFATLVAVGDTGTIKDFTFNPFSAITDFFTVNTVSFNLDSINVELQSDNFLIISGIGTFVVPGFEDTAGEWNFTGQTVTGTGTFSWSASTGASPEVPEPATLSLLGLGLVAIGFAARRKRS